LDCLKVTDIVFFILSLDSENRPMDRHLNVEEAVQFVLTPGSDSELSGLSEDDEDEQDEINQYHQQEKNSNTNQT